MTMPSQRRVKVFGLVVVIVVLMTLYMTGSARQTRSSDFYTKTQEALQSREYEQAAKQRDEADTRTRLKAAEEAAKKAADEKSQKYMDSVAGGAEKSVAGRVVMKDQDDGKVPGVAAVGGRPRDREAAKQEPESEEEHEIEIELNTILKKSPIIIFSKTFCPFSRKAKHIFDMYKIVPSPHIVELDQHPLGAKLQAKLAHMTGRKTVPNILINAKSIGGGDEIEELHESKKLIDTIKSMSGKRVMEATLKDDSGRRNRRRSTE